MQRYFSLLLFLVFSIVFPFQPMMAAQGVPSGSRGDSLQNKAGSSKSAAKAVAGSTACAVSKKKSAQPKAKVTARQSTLKTKKIKSQQVAKDVTPAQNSRAHVAKKQAGVAEPTAAPPVVVTRKVPARPVSVAAPRKGSNDDDVDAVADNLTQISSKSFMVMDAGSGVTLLARAPDSPRQPASTIKIVTAMIALKSLKYDDVVSVSTRASGMPSSKIFLDPKQNYRVNDLINAVMLASANDASVALAEKIAGTEDRFANLMTLSARIWGAQNTICRTASGLTAEGQQSTARDLANLFRYAMQHDEFAQRMHEKQIATSYGKTLLNHNKALWRVDGAVAGKTGYTVAARQTYVGQFSRGGGSIVVAIMGSETMWADLKKLVDYGFSKKEHLARSRFNSNSQNTALVN
jgi:D-alanyl-D-alanine carboxypeptidase (penicillin-binding protein 5/6)